MQIVILYHEFEEYHPYNEPILSYSIILHDYSFFHLK